MKKESELKNLLAHNEFIDQNKPNYVTTSQKKPLAGPAILEEKQGKKMVNRELMESRELRSIFMPNM